MTIFSSFGLAVVAVAVVVAVVASATAATCIDWAVLRCYSGSHRYSYRLGRLVLLFRRAICVCIIRCIKLCPVGPSCVVVRRAVNNTTIIDRVLLYSK